MHLYRLDIALWYINSPSISPILITTRLGISKARLLESPSGSFSVEKCTFLVFHVSKKSTHIPFRRDRCKVYGWIGGDRPSDVLEQAKVRKEQGFTAVKMNAVESLGWLDSPSALDATVERLRQVKSLGLDAGLDFHGRVHRPLAKQLAKALEPHRPLFIEEPLLPGQHQELVALYASTSIPIAVRRFDRLQEI